MTSREPEGAPLFLDLVEAQLGFSGIGRGRCSLFARCAPVWQLGAGHLGVDDKGTVRLGRGCDALKECAGQQIPCTLGALGRRVAHGQVVAPSLPRPPAAPGVSAAVPWLDAVALRLITWHVCMATMCRASPSGFALPPVLPRMPAAQADARSPFPLAVRMLSSQAYQQAGLAGLMKNSRAPAATGPFIPAPA